MTILADNQLLLLDTLVYCFGREAEVTPGATIAQICMDVDTGIKRRMQREGADFGTNMAERMNYESWFVVIDAIRRDPQLAELELTSFEMDDMGAKLASLVAPDGQTYVIFAGTGKFEWPDNCTAGYQVSSQQQDRALTWFREQVIPKVEGRIVVSGHSKGGNKTMYITVREHELIERAVSFDGQGFSREFIETYGSAIEAAQPKIWCYALDNDYVNGLLDPIALDEQRLFLASHDLDDPVASHSPFSLFAPRTEDSFELQLSEPGPQGDMGAAMAQLNTFVQAEASREEWARICDFLGPALEGLISSGLTNDERIARSRQLYKNPDLPLTVGYLFRFFQSIGRNVQPSDIVKFLLPKSSEVEEIRVDTEDPQGFSDRLFAQLPDSLQAKIEDFRGRE